MAISRDLLLSTMLVVLSGPVAAQDTPHVTWHDDGTVTLKSDPEYGMEITTTQGGAGRPVRSRPRSPSRARTVTILSLDSGPKGGISGPIYMFRPIWEELTGAKLNIALTPISELYTKTFLDLRNGTGEYDAIIVGAFFYGDLIAGKYILPVDEWRRAASTRNGTTT